MKMCVFVRVHVRRPDSRRRDAPDLRPQFGFEVRLPHPPECQPPDQLSKRTRQPPIRASERWNRFRGSHGTLAHQHQMASDAQPRIFPGQPDGVVESFTNGHQRRARNDAVAKGFEDAGIHAARVAEIVSVDNQPPHAWRVGSRQTARK